MSAGSAHPVPSSPNPAGAVLAPRTGPSPLPDGVAATLAFLAAGAVLVLEVLALRLVGPYVGVTLQTSSAVIGVSLGAIAYGAWAGGRLADRRNPRLLLAPAFLLAAATTALILPTVRACGELLRGDSAGSILLLAALAVFVPAALLSAIAPILVKLQLSDVRHTGRIVGALSSIGTLGGITATLVTGFVLVAALPTATILLSLSGLLGLAGGLLWLWQAGIWPADGRRRAGRARSRRASRDTGETQRPWLGVGTVLLLGGGLATAVAPSPCDVETAYHCARIVSDPARPSGRLLLLNSARHSYVDLADARHLEFAYTQWLGAVIDLLADPGTPVRALHLGGGGFTMPRYVAETRPGSHNRVLELDAGLVQLDEERLGVVPGPDLSIVVGDARVLLMREPSQAYGLVVGDAFGHLAVPWHLTTREFVTDVRRVLDGGGVYALNVIDYPPDRLIRAELATVMAVFAHVAVIAPQTVLDGEHRGSNFLVVAADEPLPVAELAALVGAVARPATVLTGPALVDYVGAARVLTDDYAPVDQLLHSI